MSEKKLIRLEREVIEALLNGASKFIVPISDANVVWLHDTDYKFIDEIMPLKIGDEIYFGNETLCEECVNYVEVAGGEKIKEYLLCD